jgi:sarcosine oxidase subunit delta
MRIPCPFCGERGHEEFAYLGDAGPARPPGRGQPAGPAPSATAWHDYVYLRDNPSGTHDELWQHTGGCRSWLVVTRDTRTHAISAVRFARDAALARSAGR